MCVYFNVSLCIYIDKFFIFVFFLVCSFFIVWLNVVMFFSKKYVFCLLNGILGKFVFGIMLIWMVIIFCWKINNGK